jgi:MFS family permease
MDFAPFFLNVQGTLARMSRQAKSREEKRAKPQAEILMNGLVQAPVTVRATQVRYLVLAALCVATTIAYIDRGCISVAEKDIRDELSLTSDQMGVLLGAFFATYAIFQLPTGWLGHVWGTRWALPFFALLWSLATAIGAVSHSYPALLISRLGMGAAEAGVFPCATNTIARWFPANRRAGASGVLGSFMGVGAALGAVLTGGLLEGGLTWQMILAVYATAGFLWAFWFVWWFRERPEEAAGVNEAELTLIRGGAAEASTAEGEPLAKEQTAATPWRAILTSPALGWISAQQFFRAASYIFYMSWFPTYLKETHGVSTLEAGALTSLPLWAQMFGSFAGGILSDVILTRTGSRRLARQGQAFASLIVCTGLIGLAYPIADPLLAVLLISAGAFCGSLAGPCAYAITIDMGGKQVAPIFSVMNMAGNVGAIIFPIVASRVKTATGNWDAVFVLFVVLHLVAALCWLPFNPEGKIVPELGERGP